MYNKLNLIMRGVYRLTCDDPELVYYGSSDDIYKREIIHKSNHKKYKEGNTIKYCASSKLYEVGGVEVELVLECPDDISKREMEEIEQTYIDNDNCVNFRKAFRTEEEKKEYSKEYNKSDKFKNYMKIYNKSNKYKEYQKAYEQTEKAKESKRDYDFTKYIFKQFFP